MIKTYFFKYEANFNETTALINTKITARDEEGYSILVFGSVTHRPRRTRVIHVHTLLQ